ncbi:MAG: selenocysteine-specific translation elongation factor [Actinomycetota bacterium]|nr:selenocysteine-specific translation elongation factor [Actinomycetota bacterium]
MSECQEEQKNQRESYFRKFTIGTAGHIDHGKTVLVKALTGTDTDRLAEEKKRGISIDLGFAPFELSNGTIVGIVDVPGHENFIRNMLAGATGIDLALLVVAADDGVMPQTREHLAILDLLGVKSGIGVITKIDLVDEELVELTIEEVRELLSGTKLSNSPVIPVSALNGQGLAELKREIESAAMSVELKNTNLPVRMPIDRVFSLKGIGTVVTGTLLSGQVRCGDNLIIEPKGIEARIRSVQVHGKEKEYAIAGERTAVNISGVPKENLARGDVLIAKGFLQPTYMIDAKIRLLKSSKPLKRGARVRFHHGTSEIMGRVYALDGREILSGESKHAQIRLEQRAICAPGDRFVIRSYSPVTTIGGGKILDISPGKHRFSDTKAIREMELLESGDERDVVFIHLSRAAYPQTLEEIAPRSGIPHEELKGILDYLILGGRALRLADKKQDWYLPLELSAQKEKETLALINKHLELHPLSAGLEKETLKKKAFARWKDRPFELFFEMLVKNGSLTYDEKFVSLPGRRAIITEKQSKILEEIVTRIEEACFSPPTINELSETLSVEKSELEKLLSFAEREKRIVKVSTDIYYSQEKIRELEQILRKTVSSNREGITVSEFRQAAGTTRKYALPVLEYFDRNHVTIRIKDRRKLR